MGCYMTGRCKRVCVEWVSDDMIGKWYLPVRIEGVCDVRVLCEGSMRGMVCDDML